MKKDWLEREVTMEIIVGVFILMVFLGMGYFTIMLTREWVFSKNPTVEARFVNVMGLREGDGVVVRGMTVGKVKKLSLKEDGVHVVALMDPGTKLRFKTDYKLSITPTSVLGGRYLEIVEGSDHAPELPEGTPLVGQKPYDLIGDAAALVNEVRQGFVEGKIVANLTEAADQIKIITARIGAGKGTLGKLMSEDDTLYKDVAASAASIKSITGTIEKGEGSIGRLVKDENLYKEVEGVVKDARAAIDDFRETTPVTTFASIFFAVF